jgi:DNA-binding Lrp family transcriptional regulator
VGRWLDGGARAEAPEYQAQVDLKALNRAVQALIAVQVRPLKRSVIDDFKDSVSQLPEVMTVFVLAGGDDFLLHVAVQDLDICTPRTSGQWHFATIPAE